MTATANLATIHIAAQKATRQKRGPTVAGLYVVAAITQAFLGSDYV